MNVLLVGGYPEFVAREIKKKAKLVVIRKSGREKIEREIANAEILVVTPETKIDKKLLEKARGLKAVITFSHGYEHVDTDALREMGIKFYSVPGSTSSVAELTFGLMIAVLRKIPEHDRCMKKGGWRKGMEDFGYELRRKTLGVVGMGPIGREVCRIAKAFGMEVVACDPNRLMEGKPEVKMVGLDKLLEISDIVSLHAHLNEETFHMIGTRELEKMKKSAVLINTARGGLVDSKALYKALKSGRIAGAGLDVFEREPPGKDKLVSLPNVVCTPHAGADTFESEERKGRMLLGILKRF